MKKFLKAVALATVMCMLLSVSAFASVGTATPNTTDKTIAISVTATAGTQVALLIVDSSVASLASLNDDSKIMFIDQKEAVSGTADFGNVTIKDTNATVDIYVGNANFDGAQLIGDDISLADAAEIKIVTGGKYFENVKGDAGVKGGVAAALTVDLDGLTVSKMIWAFKVGDAWKYSQSIDASGLNGNDVVDGAVQYAVALDAFDANMNEITVSDVAAIFLTTEAKDNEYVVGTDADLMGDKKTN